ncbi:MAG: hypothetical protein MZU97_21395 [Bacillus subtilis]|nr:hypothetical protein [Bacillus subtilis]
MHAEITSFGLKWAFVVQRNGTQVCAASSTPAKDVEVGKICGAVGNYAFTDPDRRSATY